jgi:hypothetical protein
MTDRLEKPTVVTGDPRTLTLLDVNARYMTSQQFEKLTNNLKRDGVLTSLPLVWNDAESGRRIVLSGNHRTKAAIAAGFEEIDWYEIQQPLERQRQIALQLSHNAIAGQDDPAILKELWEEIEEIDYREYAALDDKTLDLLDKVDLASLGEQALTYSTVQVMFLPHEVERARAIFDNILDVFSSGIDERWVAGEEEWTRLVDALDTARGAADVVNTAAAFTVLLDVVEANLDTLRDSWFNAHDGTTKHDKWVPLEAVLGTRRIPAESAAVIASAMDKARRDADVDEKQPRWLAVEMIAADYLAGA